MKALRITPLHEIELVEITDRQDAEKRIADGGAVTDIRLREGAKMYIDPEAEQKRRGQNAIASLISRKQVYGDALIVGTDPAGIAIRDVPDDYLVWLEAAG